jgi:hypothetical protein
VRAVAAVLERQRDARRIRGQARVGQDGGHELVVTVEPQRELHLLARDAVESLEEMLVVGHGGRRLQAPRA